MRNNLKAILNIILILSSGITVAQQLPQFSQYIYNKQMLNPAVTGSEKFMVVQLTHRSQWVGFGNSPKTNLLSFHSSIDKKKFGLGGYIYNDNYGPINTFGINASYAYYIPISEETNLRFGLSGTASQFSIDANKIKLNNAVDPLIDLTTSDNKHIYNGSFGLMVNNENYYMGVSILNLMPQTTKVFSSGALTAVYHYNFIGGIKIGINKQSYIYPSTLVKVIQNNPTQVDFNIRYNYSEIVEFGVSYRTDNAMALILMLKTLKNLHIIYSYDFAISNMNKASSGSHEISLRYHIFYRPIKQGKRYNLKLIKK